MKRKILVVAIVAFAGLSMLAQDKKETPKKAPAMGGILHPEMTVETGTWDKPAATIGAKPDQPWTTTSVAAGVDSKPQPGNAKTAGQKPRGKARGQAGQESGGKATGQAGQESRGKATGQAGPAGQESRGKATRHAGQSGTRRAGP